MAAALDPNEALRSTTGKANFQRVARLLISGGTSLLREIFDQVCPPSNLPTILKNPVTERQLRAAKLTKPQWDCLYPSPGVYGESSDFDITLLYRLLRTICNLIPPATGWDAPPASTDHSLAADLARIKYYRNSVYGHVNQDMEVADNKFPQLWQEISEALVRIAGQISPTKKHEWQVAIASSLKNPLTAEDERNVEELKEWYRNDMEVKESIEKLKSSTQSGMQHLEIAAKDILDQLREESRNIKEQLREVKDKLNSPAGGTEVTIGADIEDILKEIVTLVKSVEEIKEACKQGHNNLENLFECEIQRLKEQNLHSLKDQLRARLESDIKDTTEVATPSNACKQEDGEFWQQKVVKRAIGLWNGVLKLMSMLDTLLESSLKIRQMPSKSCGTRVSSSELAIQVCLLIFSVFCLITTYGEFLCLEGSIPGNTLSFVLKSEDNQVERKKGIEFTWEKLRLKNRDDLNFSSINVRGMRYFHNIDCCMYGMFGESLSVHGAPFLAVNSKCTEVYYYDTDGIWETYHNATKIQCAVDDSKQESSNSFSAFLFWTRRSKKSGQPQYVRIFLKKTFTVIAKKFSQFVAE